jgi:hypothetical protein
MRSPINGNLLFQLSVRHLIRLASSCFRLQRLFRLLLVRARWSEWPKTNTMPPQQARPQQTPRLRNKHGHSTSCACTRCSSVLSLSTARSFSFERSCETPSSNSLLDSREISASFCFIWLWSSPTITCSKPTTLIRLYTTGTRTASPLAATAFLPTAHSTYLEPARRSVIKLVSTVKEG